MEMDSHAVGRGDSTDVVSGSDGTSDGSLLLVVSDALSGEVSSSSLGDLEDDRGLVVTSGFKSGYDGRGRGDVLKRRIKMRRPSQRKFLEMAS